MGLVDNISLYLITDDLRSRERPVEEVVKAALAGGVKMIQYRPWRIADDDYTLMGMRLRGLTREAGCFLFLNARPKIALMAGADGVHVSKKSVSVPAARRRMFDTAIVGFSAHSLEEALEAEEQGADFITFSPVFPTTSSSDPRPATGIDPLLEVIEKLSIPVFPLGGIGIEQVKELKAAGVKRAAVVSAITESEDIEKATRELLEALDS